MPPCWWIRPKKSSSEKEAFSLAVSIELAESISWLIEHLPALSTRLSSGENLNLVTRIVQGADLKECLVRIWFLRSKYISERHNNIRGLWDQPSLAKLFLLEFLASRINSGERNSRRSCFQYENPEEYAKFLETLLAKTTAAPARESLTSLKIMGSCEEKSALTSLRPKDFFTAKVVESSHYSLGRN